jgi:chromosome segregation ATPase
MLKSFEEKIAYAVEKVKTLREEKTFLEKRTTELESALSSKDREIEILTEEKAVIKKQVEDLFNELEAIDLT